MMDITARLHAYSYIPCAPRGTCGAGAGALAANMPNIRTQYGGAAPPPRNAATPPTPSRTASSAALNRRQGWLPSVPHVAAPGRCVIRSAGDSSSDPDRGARPIPNVPVTAPAAADSDGDELLGTPAPLPPESPVAPGPRKRVRKSKAVSAAAGLAAAGPPADDSAGEATLPGGSAATGSNAKPKRVRTRKAPQDAASASTSASTSASASAAASTSPESSSIASSLTSTRSSDSEDDAASVGAVGAARRAVSRPAGASAGGGVTAAPRSATDGPVAFSSKLPHGSAWADKQRWVVFSDLHVRESSLATCLEVLRAVEAEGRKRDAGVMFLGDFWDRRGALPVEPLNQVLQEMSSWRSPVLMLVGNHDQVDLGGLQHGLTPLELACPHVHVFDEPTVWHGALWLPYRRETWVLERAMAQATRAAEEAGQPLKAIFLHADVRTARTNQWRQAEEGLEPAAFPPSLPVYSGHYHLPHTVRGTNITYIGSPYQVSMNEASETKRLLVLDAPSWRVVEEIPVTIGPRHMRLSGPAACDRLQQLAHAAATGAAAATSLVNAASANVDGEGDDGQGGGGGGEDSGSAAAAAGPQALRQGDRVKLWLSTAEAQDGAVVQAMAELERAGVAVEQVLQPEFRAPRLQAAEGLSIDDLVEMYCSGAGGGGGAGAPGGMSEAAAAAVRGAVAAARDAAGAGGDGEGSCGRCVELELESVRLRGFGPFVEEQTYPLAGRGVRVIVGENRDEPGADSNGSGKTSLVTAPLWALTGDVLARTESGGGGRIPVDAMRNDSCAVCSVGLRGRINGEPFEVEREVKRGKTSGLTFRLGDEDLTMQDISGTADRIRRRFSTELLRSSAFFGQNDITTLLEANDAALKQKLGLVVDLEIWEAARQLLTAPRKAAAAAAAQEAGRVRVLAEQRGRRAAEVEELRRREAEWEVEHARRMDQHAADVSQRAAQAVAAAGELAPRAWTARWLAAELRAAAAAAEDEQRRWEAEVQAQRAARQAELAAAPPPPQPSPAPAPTVSSDAVGGSSSSNTTTTDGSGSSSRQEEEDAFQLLRVRQEEAGSLQQALGERHHAASQALGRLRQLEASMQEYVAAVAAAAAAAAGQPAVAAAAVTNPWEGGAQLALLQRPHGHNGHNGGNDHNGHNGHNGSNGSSVTPGGGGGLLEWDEQGGGRAVVAGAAAIRAICDRCRQPISEELYAANVERLEGGVKEARRLCDIAASELREAQMAHAAAAALAGEADAALASLARRRIESERRAATLAMAAAAAAEREARAAAAAARREQEAVWREAEESLRGLQERTAASARMRGDLMVAASEVERTAADLDQAAAAWAVHADGARRDSGAAAAAATSPPQLLDSATGSDDDWGQVGSAGAVVVADRRGELGAEEGPGRGRGGVLTAAELLAESRTLAAAGRQAAQVAARCLAAWLAAVQAAAAARREPNPRGELRARAQRELVELEVQVALAEEAVAAADSHAAALTDADSALGRSGISSLVLDDVLTQLQAYTADYLTELCDDFVLELSATKPAGAAGAPSAGGGRATVKEKEEIHKVVKVRNPTDGSLRQRDVRQLSGGERRRVALALCLGFEALVRRRRRLVCNVMVLDEVLQQLDNTGCELVAGVLRDLPHASVLVVGQTNSSVTSNFDLMDVVVKEGGAAHVRIAA